MKPIVVIVPAYNRPELLALCLGHLSACPEIYNAEVWVRYEGNNPNGQFLEESRTVTRQFEQFMDVHFSVCGTHLGHGNSYNVLTAYRDALGRGTQWIFLVEEDVLVSPDFFRWHGAMRQRNPDMFCSVGWHCLRRSDIPREGPIGRCAPLDHNAFFTSREDYASIGVCWPAKSLERIVQHCNEEYFRNPVGYNQSRFPGSKLSLDFCEQDGVIMRVLEQVKEPVVWPLVRRCSHVGWWGYHRPSQPRVTGPGGQVGDFRLRFEQARTIVNDARLLEGAAGGLYGGDCEPVVNVPTWRFEDLRCDRCL